MIELDCDAIQASMQVDTQKLYSRLQQIEQKFDQIQGSSDIPVDDKSDVEMEDMLDEVDKIVKLASRTHLQLICQK